MNTDSECCYNKYVNTNIPFFSWCINSMCEFIGKKTIQYISVIDAIILTKNLLELQLLYIFSLK